LIVKKLRHSANISLLGATPSKIETEHSSKPKAVSSADLTASKIDLAAPTQPQKYYRIILSRPKIPLIRPSVRRPLQASLVQALETGLKSKSRLEHKLSDESSRGLTRMITRSFHDVIMDQDLEARIFTPKSEGERLGVPHNGELTFYGTYCLHHLFSHLLLFDKDCDYRPYGIAISAAVKTKYH